MQRALRRSPPWCIDVHHSDRIVELISMLTTVLCRTAKSSLFVGEGHENQAATTFSAGENPCNLNEAADARRVVGSTDAFELTIVVCADYRTFRRPIGSR